MSEKSLEMYGMLNEEVDSRMDLLLNLSKDVSSSAVRLFEKNVVYLCMCFLFLA